MLCTTTIEDADLKECLGNMGRTQVVERWCKVPVLQAAEPWPDKAYTHACIDADTQCLHLISLSFDSEMTIFEAIQHWRHCVACCEYGLAPEFIMLD